MLKHHQACATVLPVQLPSSRGSNMLQSNGSRTFMSTQNIPSTTPLLITRQQRNTMQNPLTSRSSSKLATRRHLRQQFHQQSYSHHHQQRHHHLHQHQHHHQKPKVIRASEYKNLRQVVPALRRQRDVGKVEVVTEAARYIDHLHKTLIERFVLCGIPDSLKDILGTDDANELNSQHIMNLVTRMASKQTTPVSVTTTTATTTTGGLNNNRSRATISARDSLPLTGSQRTPMRNCATTQIVRNSRHIETPTTITSLTPPIHNRRRAS